MKRRTIFYAGMIYMETDEPVSGSQLPDGAYAHIIHANKHRVWYQIRNSCYEHIDIEDVPKNLELMLLLME